MPLFIDKGNVNAKTCENMKVSLGLKPHEIFDKVCVCGWGGGWGRGGSSKSAHAGISFKLSALFAQGSATITILLFYIEELCVSVKLPDLHPA